jgi:hypothetical protein
MISFIKKLLEKLEFRFDEEIKIVKIKKREVKRKVLLYLLFLQKRFI